MGRQSEKDEKWDVPGDNVSPELSPLLVTRKHGLFQRIERQRAAYFADVEDGQDHEDLENEDGDKRDVDKLNGQQRRASAASVGFADLSTWCCDALLPAGAHLASSEKRPAWMISVMDQPTLVLSLVTSASMQMADLPTVPLLPVLSVTRGSFAASRLLLLAGGKKARGTLTRFCRCFLHLLFLCVHCAARLRESRRPALSGHEMLMERLRAREQNSVVPPALSAPSSTRPVRQFRLPADSLFS